MNNYQTTNVTNITIIICILLLVYLLYTNYYRENFDASVQAINTNKLDLSRYLKDKLLIKKTNKYKKIFNNDKYTVWMPYNIDNYFPVGYYITLNNKPPTIFATLVLNHKDYSIIPEKFNIISISDKNYGIWQPYNIEKNIKYRPISNVYSKEYPSKFLIRLIPEKFLKKTSLKELLITNNISKTDKGYELWSVKESEFPVCNNLNNINEVNNLKNIYCIDPLKTQIEKKLYIKYTRSYKKLIEYKDKKLNKYFCIWRPIPPNNFCSLGDIVLSKKVNPNNSLETIVAHKSFCKPPLGYGKKYIQKLSINNEIYSFWRPQANDNYIFLSDIIVKGEDEPKSDNIISSLSVDFFDKKEIDTHHLLWNNVNENNQISIWQSQNNFLSVNNTYTKPIYNGIVLNKNYTTSDQDMLDNSQLILLNYKKNNKYLKNINTVELSNLIKKSLSQKLDIDINRLDINNISRKKNSITLNLLPRNASSNEITIKETINKLEKILSIDNIRIYNLEKTNFLIKIYEVKLINNTLNIEIDNTEFTNQYK